MHNRVSLRLMLALLFFNSVPCLLRGTDPAAPIPAPYSGNIGITFPPPSRKAPADPYPIMPVAFLIAAVTMGTALANYLWHTTDKKHLEKLFHQLNDIRTRYAEELALQSSTEDNKDTSLICCLYKNSSSNYFPILYYLDSLKKTIDTLQASHDKVVLQNKSLKDNLYNQEYNDYLAESDALITQLKELRTTLMMLKKDECRKEKMLHHTMMTSDQLIAKIYEFIGSF